MNSLETVKEAVPVEDYAQTRTELRPSGVRRVRRRLMCSIVELEIASIPNPEERASEASLVWDRLLPVAQMMVSCLREDAR